MQKVAFLDRDGTINIDHGYVHQIHEWEFCKGAIDAIAMLRDAGYAVAVVTNQSGIGRGLFKAADVEQLHKHALSQMADAGAMVDAIAYCPHAPQEECDCRKPRTGLADAIQAALGRPIDYGASWVIGDRPSDIGFGRRLGTRCGLIRSRYWDANTLTVCPDIFGDSLHEIAKNITSNSY